MRSLVFSLALMPGLVLADTIPLHAPVTSVILYSEGGTVTREVPFSAPAGRHDLVITNLPDTVAPELLRVEVDGARLDAINVRQENPLPTEKIESPQFQEAEARVKHLEAQFLAITDEREDLLMTAEAADARADFLGRLNLTPEGSLYGAGLSETVATLGQEVLKARQDAASARREARQFDDPLDALQEQLEQAQMTVKALEAPDSERITLTLTVHSNGSTQGMVTLRNAIDMDSAAWEPVYDTNLVQGETPRLILERGVLIGQWTDENWNNVQLQLSTINPDQRMEVRPPYSRGHGLEDKEVVEERRRAEEALRLAEMDMLREGAMNDPRVEPMIISDAPSLTVSDGIAVTYTYPYPVSLASEAEVVRLSLGTLEFEPRVFAKANMKRDDTALLTAEFTNTSEEILLSSDTNIAYLDGQLVGAVEFPQMAPGSDAELGFGQIEGLRLQSRVLDQQDGDTGVLTSYNTRSETREFMVENFTGKEWDLRLLSSIPYSTHDDLKITLEATPPVSESNADGKRGILAWDKTLPAGDSLTIRQTHQMQWPADMVLQ